AAFFAIVAVGSISLTLRLDVNSALGAVLTGVLVVFALLGNGLRAHRSRTHAAQPPATLAVPQAGNDRGRPS
ncbi:MAG: hypothetical protein R6W93_15100, partial [Candidatus Limnocylindrales bacterium]